MHQAHETRGRGALDDADPSQRADPAVSRWRAGADGRGVPGGDARGDRFGCSRDFASARLTFFAHGLVHFNDVHLWLWS